jgi:exodeoxyribonuclease VII large subunit
MVVRGGGDPSGLASLSDEDVARDLLAIPVPVITGLGHARDRTLLGEIAWRAADNPTLDQWRSVHKNPMFSPVLTESC